MSNDDLFDHYVASATSNSSKTMTLLARMLRKTSVIDAFPTCSLVWSYGAKFFKAASVRNSWSISAEVSPMSWRNWHG